MHLLVERQFSCACAAAVQISDNRACSGSRNRQLLRRDIACWIVVCCVCGLYFSKEEPRVRVGRLHGHSRPRPRPWSCWSLLRRHHFDPAVVFSIYCRPLARAQPSTTLVLLVASSPALRSCRRFLDLLSAACTRPRPWSCSLLLHHHFDPAVVFSIYG